MVINETALLAALEQLLGEMAVPGSAVVTFAAAEDSRIGWRHIERGEVVRLEIRGADNTASQGRLQKIIQLGSPSTGEGTNELHF